MVQPRPPPPKDGYNNQSSILRVQLARWPKKNEHKSGVHSTFAITSQPEFVQPQIPTKSQDQAALANVNSQTPAKAHGVVGGRSSNNEEENKELCYTSFVEEGLALHTKGDYNKALKAFQSALKSQMTTVPGPGIAQTLANIGAVYLRQGRLFLAAEALEESLRLKKMFKKELGRRICMADVLNNLGNLAFLRGDGALSISYYQSAVKDIRFGGNKPSEDIFLAQAKHNIGRISVLQGEWDTALTTLTQCLRIEQDLYGSKHIESAETLELLGFIYLSSGDYDNAMISFSEVLSLYQKKFGVVNTDVAKSLMNIGMVMESQCQLKEAWHSYATARDVYRKVGVDVSHRGLKVASQNIQNIERQLELQARREQKKETEKTFLSIETAEQMARINGNMDDSREEEETVAYEI